MKFGCKVAIPSDDGGLLELSPKSHGSRAVPSVSQQHHNTSMSNRAADKPGTTTGIKPSTILGRSHAVSSKLATKPATNPASNSMISSKAPANTIKPSNTITDKSARNNTSKPTTTTNKPADNSQQWTTLKRIRLAAAVRPALPPRNLNHGAAVLAAPKSNLNLGAAVRTAPKTDVANAGPTPSDVAKAAEMSTSSNKRKRSGWKPLEEQGIKKDAVKEYIQLYNKHSQLQQAAAQAKVTVAQQAQVLISSMEVANIKQFKVPYCTMMVVIKECKGKELDVL